MSISYCLDRIYIFTSFFVLFLLCFNESSFISSMILFDWSKLDFLFLLLCVY